MLYPHYLNDSLAPKSHDGVTGDANQEVSHALES